MTSARTPASLGYRMPAEWHPHESTWIAWPTNPLTWPDQLLDVQNAYREFIRAVSPHERIDILIDDSETERAIRASLKESPIPCDHLVFHVIPTVDAWIRDYGPNFLLRGSHGSQLAYNHWGFNAWGDKYEDLKKDAAIPEMLEAVLRVPRFMPGMVLEGGSIDVNGQGVCLTTRQCLLHRNRNPSCSPSEIELCLKEYLGVEQIVWLNQGIAGDDTDGHVDDIARFVGPDRILCAVEEDPQDENWEALQDNFRLLQSARDRGGRGFEIVRLPMPGRLESPEGRLPASYANFYIANGVVIVPTFDDPNDEAALEIIQECFPNRRVVGINCRVVVSGLGAFHCLTQQQPAL